MLAITNSLFSQIDSTKVPFISYWSIGDSYDFKISKIEISFENNNDLKNLEDEIKNEILKNWKRGTRNSCSIR